MDLLEKKLWTCNCNAEMSLAVLTPYGTSNLEVHGNFRTKKDLGALIWYSQDTWSHSSQQYNRVTDFTGVVWSFHLALSGPVKPLDELHGPTLTVYSTDGSCKYVRLWNYVGAGATPTEADITIDFDDLKAGWSADDPVDQKHIDRLSISFVHEDYDGSVTDPLDDSYEFGAVFSSWSVTGGQSLTDPDPLPAHSYRWADGYDDSGTVTPQRLVEQIYNLGFRGPINLYVGASHYYDKVAPTPWESWDYTEYRYELITDTGRELNAAAEAWLSDFFLWAAYKGFSYVVASVSLEMVDPPLSWSQKTWDGSYGRTAWGPRPFVLDAFCNTDAQDYYKRLAIRLCDLQDAAGLPVVYQLGESWWWTQDGAPCFYGDATKEAFKADYGYYPHEFHSVFDDITGYEATIAWMQDKNGDYAHLLRDHVKLAYPSAQFTVLFFPPSVVDPDTAGEMMTIANYPKTHWSKPELDFFQLEDYDWLINNDVEWHYQIWDMAQTDLGYNTDEMQYFAGFVLQPYQTSVWRRVSHAATEAICRGFKDAFIWAGPQIRRDSWTPPSADYTGYLLWWGFFTAYEEDNAILLDKSGWYNDGALDGTRFQDIPAKGKVLMFEDAGDRAWVTVCGSQYALSEFTLETWIYVGSSFTGSILYRQELHLALNSGYPAVTFYDGSDWITLAGSKQVSIGAWTHVAAVYTGAKLQLYLNGVLTDEANATGTTPEVTTDFVVGTSPSGQFYGKVAEVVVKSVQSTQATIREDMRRWLWREGLQVIELVEVTMPDSEEPLLLTSWGQEITVTSRTPAGEEVTYTYSPIGYSRGGVRREMVGTITHLKAKLAASEEFMTWLGANDIRGGRLTIKLTLADLDHDNPDNTAVIFDGVITGWALQNQVLEVQARENSIDLGGPIPPAQFDYFCRHYFKRGRCLYSGTETECAKTETACSNYANLIHFGGFKFVPRLMRSRV